MKKILCGCLIALGIFIVTCLVLISLLIFALKDSYLSKEEIFDVVNKKYDVIMNDIEKDDFTKSDRIKGITGIKKDDGVIAFSCGGRGNVASGVYYGFYYTEDDSPKVSFLGYVLYDEEDLKPEGNGYCFDAYDYYYTEKIRDNFFYYEAWY